MDEKEPKRRVVRIRVEAEPEIVEGVAEAIGMMLENDGYELIDQSVPYQNRQDPGIARVYVTVR